MLGTEGEFVFSLTIGDYTNIIDSLDDLVEFTVIEEAGNVLPTCILGFVTSEDRILPLLNDGHIIKAKLGRTLENIKDIEISVSKFISSKQGDEQRFFEITGFASKIDHITDTSTEISDKKSAIEVVIEKAGKNFIVDTNIQKSKDKQNWIQYSITDKTFMNQCLMHCDLGNSFPLYAITADGRFILRDALKYIKANKNKHKWKFSRFISDDRDVIYDGDAILSSDSGFINNWLGYGRTTLAYDLDTKEVKEVNIKTETLLSLSQELDKSKAISDRFGGTRGQSESVHKKFWEAYHHNLQSTVNLGRIGMSFSVSGTFIDIAPLDLGVFSEPSTQGGMSSEYHTGTYLVSKVVRTIANKRLTTIIMLNREALNNIKNEV